ncbi:hypothetical protein IAE22_34320, partial [Bacillus sp. S34]|nr:hypothetical protein [Bacillus sp. S34]
PPGLGPCDEPRTADAGDDAGDGWSGWFGLLAESAVLPADDPDALARQGPPGGDDPGGQRVVRTDVERTSTFAVDDALLQWIHDATMHTVEN